MTSILKAISLDDPDYSFENFSPEEKTDFFLTLVLHIGPEDCKSEHLFNLYICTPNWINCSSETALWGRHFLIVKEFDRSLIERKIRKIIQDSDEKDWEKTAIKLSRYFEWEYEDYAY